MTASILLAAVVVVLLLLHLARSRGQRSRRQIVAVQRRRALRERQWRSMIRDADRGER